MRQDLVAVVEALVDPSLLVGVSRERVIRAIQRHEVEGARQAGRWVVNLDSLRVWVQSKGATARDAAEAEPSSPEAA